MQFLNLSCEGDLYKRQAEIHGANIQYLDQRSDKAWADLQRHSIRLLTGSAIGLFPTEFTKTKRHFQCPMLCLPSDLSWGLKLLVVILFTLLQLLPRTNMCDAVVPLRHISSLWCRVYCGAVISLALILIIMITVLILDTLTTKRISDLKWKVRQSET